MTNCKMITQHPFQFSNKLPGSTLTYFLYCIFPVHREISIPIERPLLVWPPKKNGLNNQTTSLARLQPIWSGFWPLLSPHCISSTQRYSHELESHLVPDLKIILKVSMQKIKCTVGTPPQLGQAWKLSGWIWSGQMMVLQNIYFLDKIRINK